jgi:hypothetical protein
VPWIDRLDVHEGGNVVVSVHEAGWRFTLYNVAENARSGGHDWLEPHEGIVFLPLADVGQRYFTSFGHLAYQPVQVVCTTNQLSPQSRDHISFAKASLLGR